MAQISIDIDDTTAEMLRAAAKLYNCSVSEHAASIISEKLGESARKEARKKDILKKLRGAMKDHDIAEPPEIPWDAETPGRLDLL